MTINMITVKHILSQTLKGGQSLTLYIHYIFLYISTPEITMPLNQDIYSEGV